MTTEATSSMSGRIDPATGATEPGAMELWREFQGSVTAFVRATGALVLAESRLAASSAVTMLLLILLAAFAALVGWTLLVVAAGYGLWQLGVPIWGVCVVFALLHAGATIGLWRGAIHLGGNLEFPHTRRVIARSWTVGPVQADG